MKTEVENVVSETGILIAPIEERKGLMRISSPGAEGSQVVLL